MTILSPRSIVMFIGSLHGGGAERVFLRLARLLHERGHAVTLATLDAPPEARGWVPHGVDVVSFGVDSLGGALLPLARLLRRRRPDAVLSAVSGANVIAIAARTLARVDAAVVVSEHNTQSRQRVDATSLRRRTLTPWLMSRTYPRADAIVAVSDGVRDDLVTWLGLAPSSVTAIVNPVVDDALMSASHESIGEPWNTSISDAPLIVSAGRLEPHKDHTTLLRAFAIVHGRRPGVRLAILGDGETRGAIEAAIDEFGLCGAVVLAGFQDNPFAWLTRADVLVLTSHYEGLPTILIEALACGARVVSTDCPSGPRQILADGRWGALVPIGDADAIARALLEALDAGRWTEPPDEALVAYRPDAVVDAYLGTIEAAISARRPAAVPPTGG